ncbi:multidrug transporter [Stutzerimonas nitrititolerans]|uniref:multidrug transporter n=1 Tax=Stutzerimonas nitrititolerans TaxID=2482751 RepID=UPI0028A1E8CD|nr:multidrug transporter [Stutzerimonas nitrititolerans]
MLIGALLIATWVILLVRYPLRALPISLGAVLGLGLVAGWVLWQEQRERSLLAQLELRLSHAPEHCSASQPLHVVLRNQSPQPLQNLQWEIAAYAPGTQVNLVEVRHDSPRYEGPGDLQSGAQWEACMPLPSLRPGYRARTLRFSAERLQGRFAD